MNAALARPRPSAESLHVIIHAAATAAAGIAAGLAQLPGSDAGPLMTIQTGMLTAIAAKFDVALTHAAAVDIVMTYSATFTGRAVSQWLLGWIPGLGNAINATTAAAITEAIGWAAVTHFEGD